MLPADFWHGITFSEFQRKAFFFFRNRNDLFKDNWERVRQQVYFLAMVNGGKGTAEEYMPFAWDKKTVVKRAKPITAQEADNILKRYGLKHN